MNSKYSVKLENVEGSVTEVLVPRETFEDLPNNKDSAMLYSRSQMGMRCKECGNDFFEQYEIRDITVVPVAPRFGGGFNVHLRLHVDNGAVTVSLPCPCLQH